MASFDIASLFTNIPVDETIEIISNRLLVKPGTAEHRSTGTRNTRTPEQ